MIKRLLFFLLLLPSLGWGAIAVESENASEYTAGAAGQTVTLPATISASSLLVCVVGYHNSITSTWPGSWTELYDVQSATGSQTAGYLVADGTEDSTTITVTASTGVRSQHKCYSITDYTGTPTTANASATSSATSDPPIVSGLTSDTYLSIAISTMRNDETVSTYPSGYANTGYDQGGVPAGNVTIGWARKTFTGTSEDPGAFTWGASDQNIASTIVVQQAASSPTVTLSDATPDIDTTVTATLSGAFGAGGNPTTVTFSGGDTVSCSSATSTTCDFPLNYSALVAAGDLGTTQVEVADTITVTNGTETSQSTAINIQIPASGYAIVNLTCTAGVDCSADSEAISPMTTNDDCAIKVTSGILNHLSTECAPVFDTSSFAYTVARYDESATAWLAQEEVTVTAPSSTIPRPRMKGVRMGH